MTSWLTPIWWNASKLNQCGNDGAVTVDGAFDDPGRIALITAERRYKRLGIPVTEWGMIDQARDFG